MKRNRVKTIFDVLFIILLIVCGIILSVCSNTILKTVSTIFIIVLFIIKVIFNLIVWRCPKCRSILPKKLFYQDVLNCPYCGTNLYDHDIQ